MAYRDRVNHGRRARGVAWEGHAGDSHFVVHGDGVGQFGLLLESEPTKLNDFEGLVAHFIGSPGVVDHALQLLHELRLRDFDVEVRASVFDANVEQLEGKQLNIGILVLHALAQRRHSLLGRDLFAADVVGNIQLRIDNVVLRRQRLGRRLVYTSARMSVPKDGLSLPAHQLTHRMASSSQI